MHRLLLLAAVLAAASLALFFRSAGPVDDDYIIYRYAENLLQGKGLVFNEGQRVEGFTHPLWVFLIAGGMSLGLAPWHLSVVVSIVAACACVLAVGVAWRARNPDSRWPVPAIVLALSPALAMHAVAGLGTTLLAALCAGWFACWITSDRHPRARHAATALLGLAGLARAEAMVFVLPYAWIEHRRRRAWSPLLALAPAAAWAVFRVAYYDSLLPVTYYVKKLSLGEDLGYGLRYLAESTAASGIGLLVALALFGALARPRACCSAERGALVGLLLHTAYVVYVGGDYMLYARFFIPTLPIAVFLACSGGRAILHGRALRAVAFAAVVLSLLPLRFRAEAIELYARNEERWIAVGRTLERALDDEASIALSAVGATAFFSKADVVDMLGLTNDAVRHVEPDLEIELKGHHRHDAGWVLDQAPDVILLGTGVMDPASMRIALYRWEEPLLDAPRFERDYRSMIMPVAGSYPLVFFLREGARAPAGARPTRRL